MVSRPSPGWERHWGADAAGGRPEDGRDRGLQQRRFARVPGREEGPLEVTAGASDDEIEIEVQDHGSGFQPSSSVGGELSLGLGLPLIAALSDSFEISGAAAGKAPG